jgi:membrane-bound lytic murein transglycosylase A
MPAVDLGGRVWLGGSARVRLEDGTLLRISYDAHNGYPFVPISRLLIERHLVTREEMSIQRIREWMQNNPDGANTVRRQNGQVGFFRIVGLNDATEAIGAQGIPLTAGRSIAVDKALHAYGTPLFIEADLLLPGTPSQSAFRRLMIAQDTGSAIVGPARADLFFGAGEEAGKLAGRIQQSGRFAMLVPRELGLPVMDASIPLPPAKPAPSLASYAFRPAASRAKSELALPGGSFHPATPASCCPAAGKARAIAGRWPFAPPCCAAAGKARAAAGRHPGAPTRRAPPCCSVAGEARAGAGKERAIGGRCSHAAYPGAAAPGKAKAIEGLCPYDAPPCRAVAGKA